MNDEEVKQDSGGLQKTPDAIDSEQPKSATGSGSGLKSKKTVKKNGGSGKKTTSKRTVSKKAGKKNDTKSKAKATVGVKKSRPEAAEKVETEESAGAPSTPLDTNAADFVAPKEEKAAVTAVSPEVSVLQGAKLDMGRLARVTLDAPSAVVAQQTQQGIVKVRNIEATVTKITAHIIPNKVIVQGTVHLQIFYVETDERVHHLGEDVAFSTMLEIPGAAPGMNAVVQPKVASVFYHLKNNGTLLEKKILLDIFVKVVEDVQVNLLQGAGPVLYLEEVIGEGTAQNLYENEVTLDIPAIKIEEIRGEITDITTEIIPDKVIVQGVIHKQIFFIDTGNLGRHQAEDVEFGVFIDIPGARPGMNVQVHPCIEDIIYQLESQTLLRQKVVIETFVKVTTPIEFRAALGDGPLMRVPELIGEGNGQILSRDVVTLDRPAEKIREITAVLTDFRKHVIFGKAILQGTIHKQIYYIGLDDGIEYHQAEDVPFSLMMDITGATSGNELLAQPVIEDVLFDLTSPTELEEKVIIAARLVVVEPHQVRLALGAGPLVKVEQVVGENLSQVLVRLTNAIISAKVVESVTVQETVQAEVVFKQQAIVENQVALPVPAIKVAEVSAQVQNLSATPIVNGLLVEGQVVKDVKFVGEDDVVRNITETVPFSIIVETPGVPPESIETVTVQIERILFNVSPDGTTVRQIIVLLAEAHYTDTSTNQFTAVTRLEAPGLNTQTVEVTAPVLTPEGVVIQQFPVITGLSGPGLSNVEQATFGVHALDVVGDGRQDLNILESVVVDP